MPRKCPPGVICIENMSFLFLLITIALAIMLYFQFEQMLVYWTKCFIERFDLLLQTTTIYINLLFV